MKNERELPFLLPLLTAVVITFSEPLTSSFIDRTPATHIDTLYSKVHVRHKVADPATVACNVSLVNEVLEELAKTQVVVKGPLRSESPRAFVEAKVVNKNIEELVSRYRAKCITWKEFDSTIFGNFDSVTIISSNSVPFERQKEVNEGRLEKTTTLNLTSLPLNDNTLEDNVGSPHGSTPSEDAHKSESVDYEHNAVPARFPHYATMCPQAQDALEEIPVVKAIDVIHWLQQSVDSSNSSSCCLKKILKVEEVHEIEKDVFGKTSKLVQKLLIDYMNWENISVNCRMVREKYYKELKSYILRFNELLVKKLLLRERRDHKNANIVGLYKNERFQRAVLFVSTEVFAFAYNSMQISSSFICKTYKTSYVEAWKIVRKFIDLFNTMPRLLFLHFRLLEEKILQCKLFAENSIVSISIHKRKSTPNLVIEVHLPANA